MLQLILINFLKDGDVGHVLRVLMSFQHVVVRWVLYRAKEFLELNENDLIQGRFDFAFLQEDGPALGKAQLKQLLLVHCRYRSLQGSLHVYADVLR